jgi:nucleoid-associated protein YgaU
MNRYSNNTIQKDTMGKRFLSTTLLPVLEPTLGDVYIIGQVGDRLDNLAFKYYQDSSYWWVIARANNIGKGDLVVPIGMQIRIPDPGMIYQIDSEYQSLNK